MAEERKHTPVAYLHDLDGTGSFHACAKGDPGAFAVYGEPYESDLLAALQELMQIREWSIRAGGMDGPLPRDVIVKFAEMQIPAVDRARAAIKRATEG